jgi:hypothetical protein
MGTPSPTGADPWPAIPYDAWQPTCTTLHLWTQIVGKVRLALTPWVNHSWHATLYVTARGLTTSVIPHPRGPFQIDLDFIDHNLLIHTDTGDQRQLPLTPRSVARFHSELLGELEGLGRPVRIHGRPSEIPDAIPFAQDDIHKDYDAQAVHRFWRALVLVDRVFNQFRTGFIGKVSPVHLFWGAFDLAVTRFSGRTAPPHPGGFPGLPDSVTREAYSHEVSSAGFWPGGGGMDEPAFFSYAYPEPEGFREASKGPGFYHEPLREYILPYEQVRTAEDPERTLLAFLQSTYDAAADSAGWDRDALECLPGRPRVPRAV